jgi:hypothetical protein
LCKSCAKIEPFAQPLSQRPVQGRAADLALEFGRMFAGLIHTQNGGRAGEVLGDDRLVAGRPAGDHDHPRGVRPPAARRLGLPLGSDQFLEFLLPCSAANCWKRRNASICSCTPFDSAIIFCWRSLAAL